MARRRRKGLGMVIWAWIVAILTFVGGLEHIGQSYNWFSILGLFPAAFAQFLQLAAGALIAIAGFWLIKDNIR